MDRERDSYQPLNEGHLDVVLPHALPCPVMCDRALHSGRNGHA